MCVDGYALPLCARVQFRLDSTRREGTSVASGLRAQSTLSTSLDAPHTARYHTLSHWSMSTSASTVWA